MELHTLAPAPGSKKKGKRVGRGQGSGKGGTSTRGHKGAQSRSGYKRKAHFEGGQMPLQRRVPKFGFKNPMRQTKRAVNLSDLEGMTETRITPATLMAVGLIKKGECYKILGNGALTKKCEVTTPFCSAKARQMIETLGGSVTIAPCP